MRRASGEGSFTGDPEIYVKKGYGYGHLSPLGPRWGTWRGFACRDFCEKRIVYLGSFLVPRGINTLRTGSFKLFKRPLPGFLTILTL